MQKKFEYYEIVKAIKSSNPILNAIINKKGYIAGDAFDDKLRKWFYAVFIFDKEIAFHCSEDDLETTGEFYKEETS